MSEGFLGRWSRRKLDVHEGKPVAEEPPAPAPGAVQPEPASAAGVVPPAEPVAEAPAVVEIPAPTLEDVQALTSESDFSRFAAADVAPEVKNAAMKKLFADPRYNVMDRLDVYIDDYSQPDPIPESMLRQLVSAKFLGLFDQEEKKEAAQELQQRAESKAQEPSPPEQARDVADNPDAEIVAQSVPAPAVPEPTDHANTDLRLQPDHAPPGEDPGRGVG
jgi:hypothetical protein